MLYKKINLQKKLILGSLFVICIINTTSVIAEIKRQDITQAFTHIYEIGGWGRDTQGNAISGGGSLVQNAKKYMTFLQNFLKKNNIKSVIDVGCGDWSFSQYIDWTGIDYVGYDVVKSVIDTNNKKFSNKNCIFLLGDATQLDLPQADLLICKDVLQHLSNEDVSLFLKQLNKFKYCLITNDVNPQTETSTNENIETGSYRIIDLTKSPFAVKGHKVLTYISDQNKKQVLCIINNPNTSKGTYKFSKDPIDVVIPCVAKDKRTLDLCINGIKKNGSNIRRIIVVSPEKLTTKAEWFNEAKFPFSKQTLINQIFKDENHEVKEQFKYWVGWVYQQLLKLYAPFVIPNISSNTLLLDADTIFLNPVKFCDKNTGAGFFNPGTEYHTAYFEHGERLLPGFKRVYTEYSGISHHMLIQKPILEDMFSTVEKIFGIEFWKAFCNCIDLDYFDKACVSEYELYFNFTFLKTNECKIRKLKWANAKLQDLEPFKKDGFHYVSCHSWMN